MYNIIDQELLDWVSGNGLPAGKPGTSNSFALTATGLVFGVGA